MYTNCNSITQYLNKLTNYVCQSNKICRPTSIYFCLNYYNTFKSIPTPVRLSDAGYLTGLSGILDLCPVQVLATPDNACVNISKLWAPPTLVFLDSHLATLAYMSIDFLSWFNKKNLGANYLQQKLNISWTRRLRFIVYGCTCTKKSEGLFFNGVVF